MTLTVGEMQRRLREYKAPRFGYRRGEDGEIEKDLFDGVLPDGWADSPAKVDAGAVLHEPPPADTPAATNAAPDALTPPYDQYGFADLRDEYKRRSGKGVKFGASHADFVKLLDELDAAG